MKHRNTLDLSEPVVYTLKYYGRNVYVSTLQDFITMFGSN